MRRAALLAGIFLALLPQAWAQSPGDFVNGQVVTAPLLNGKLGTKVDLAARNQVNGYAGLDANGQVPLSLLGLITSALSGKLNTVDLPLALGITIVKCNGVDNAGAIQSAIDGLPTAGGTIYLQGSGGICPITSGIVIGDGSVSAPSTRNGIRILGLGSATASTETLPVTGATVLRWGGPAAGVPVTVRGPIVGLDLSGLVVDCAGSCGTGFSLMHPINSRFDDLVVENWTGVAFVLSAYAAPTGVATGAQHNVMNRWKSTGPVQGSGASGMMVGASSTGSSPYLDPAQNTWIGGQFQFDASVSGSYGIALGFTDNDTFIETSTQPTYGIGTGQGLRIVPPAGTNGGSFPAEISFLNSPLLGGVNNPGTAWTTNQGITFLPYPTSDGQPLPVANGRGQFNGFTSGGTPFGLGIHSQLAGSSGQASVSFSGVTQYVGTGCASSTSGYACSLPISSSGTLRRLFAVVSNPPASGQSFTFTVWKNGAQQPASCIVASGASQCSDQANMVSVAAGDFVSVAVSGSSSVGGGMVNWGLEFDQ